MKTNILRVMALTWALGGCITVPSLSSSPEATADRISSDVVAYNEAYGSSIADQILLNALRARDRLPLFYLSMSGITEGSYTDVQAGVQIGTIGLGHGNPDWGVGQISGSRSNRAAPTYSLNPFGSATREGRGTTLQFQPVTLVILKHYWDSEWAPDMLLYLMVDSATDITTRTHHTYSNSTPDLTPCSTAGGAPCSFSDIVAFAADNRDGTRLSACLPRDALPCGARMSVTVRNAAGRPVTRTYTLELRAIDDMIYYIGSALREHGPDPRVRPTGVYPADEHSQAQWDRIARQARLFYARPADRHDDSSTFAASVTYHGQRYFSGPANSAHCIVSSASDCMDLRAGAGADVSATVLSLLTQLNVVSQSEGAQLAPVWGGPQPPPAHN